MINDSDQAVATSLILNASYRRKWYNICLAISAMDYYKVAMAYELKTKRVFSVVLLWCPI